MKKLLIALVRFYRKHISGGTKPSCRFLPTCSAYALEALEKHGAWRGSKLAVRRLLKCHPFHKQDSVVHDPVPECRNK